MGEYVAATKEGRVIIPDLAKEIEWWKSRMRPTDARFGDGLTRWTITAEYVPNLQTQEHGDVWGLMCSPSSLPALVNLTEPDVEARRAHLMIRLPTTPSEVAEVHETIAHELVHVLDAEKVGSVADKENTAHSLAPLLAELRKNEPIRAAMLARAISTPALARAYRAKETAMPDPVPPEKPADKPAMQAARAVEEIVADIAKTDSSDTATLVTLKEELANALIAKGAAPAGDNGPPSAPVPVPPVGMSQDQAYARGKAEAEASAAAAGEKKLVERFVASVEGLSEAQRAIARKMSTLADAEEAVKSYKQPGVGATLGMKREDLTKGNGSAPETAYARMRKGPTDPMVREALGLAEATPGAHGIGSAPAHILTMSFHEQSQEYLAKQRADIAKARSAT